MNLDLYLQRINYTGPVRPDLETLRQLHRHHLLTIPYENYDIHLHRPIRLDEQAFFDKLVVGNRGGWCYEMNGLFASVLREIGFKVQLLAGSVREITTEKAEGDHLVLRVDLDQPYLVDVGFANGFLEPLPLVEGTHPQGALNFRLAKEGDYWVFYNHDNRGAGRYDFTLQPYILDQFAAKCHELQTSSDSGFVRTTICQRLTQDEIWLLRGATFDKTTAATGAKETRTIESVQEYQQVLQDYFGLDLGDLSELWANVWARHQQWLLSQAATS